MNASFSRFLASLAFAIAVNSLLLPSCMAAASPASADDETLNNGEDITNPVNDFNERTQFETLPDDTLSGRTFGQLHTETETLRTDLSLFPKPDQLALRFDLPIVWSNKPTKQNNVGATQGGLGDALAQAAYVRTFDPLWAAAVGLRTILPTGTRDAFGNGKLQLAPGMGLRRKLPEISDGSYVGLLAFEFVSVAGPNYRSNINYLELQPELNFELPDEWFINSSPKIRYNMVSFKWFVPLDLMVGKKFGPRWIASVEYQYALVRDYEPYNQWVEARIGYFF